MAPKTNRVKVSKYFQGLTVETNNFAFEVKVILGLETTFLVCGWVDGWLGGLLGGWIKQKYNQLSPKLGWARAWAELGNNSQGSRKVYKLGGKVEEKGVKDFAEDLPRLATFQRMQYRPWQRMFKEKIMLNLQKKKKGEEDKERTDNILPFPRLG